MRRLVLGSLLALAILGCENVEQNAFVVKVSSINRGSPVLADVLAWDTQNEVWYIPVEVVPIEFTNRVYSRSTVIDPENFAFDFQLRSYSVRWRPADGGPTSGTGWTLAQFDFSGATSQVIPVNSSAEVGVLLGSVSMKEVTPFADLAFAAGSIPLIADIEFVGNPAIDPDDEIRIQASVLVEFANFADE